MAFLSGYLLVGLIVAAVVFVRRDRPREREIGTFMALLSDPRWFILPLLLWPLWLAMMRFPQESFVEEKASSPAPPEPLIGRSGVVVIPLNPLGRISIDGVYRDARAEAGSIPKGATVVIVARGVGRELIAKNG